MKRSQFILLIAIQILLISGIALNTYFTFLNKARIRAAQRVMIDTQDKLSSTFSFMDQVAELQSQTEQTNQPLEPGTEAPGFSLVNEEGIEVSLSDFQGSKTLLVFSQETCPYCKEFYPVLNTFQKQEPDIKVVILQVNSTPEQNRDYKKEQGIEATLLAATETDLINYNVKGTPTSILIDENGKVLGTKAVNNLDDLKHFVNAPSLQIAS